MAAEDGNGDRIISDLSVTDKAQSVCVEVNECKEDKIERDLRDNEKSSQTVVIRIEPPAGGAADETGNEIRQNTDSLNSNDSCEKHENPSLSLTESENTTESVSSEEGDGISNPAFVEDEEETEGGINKKKKGHQRRPSCSPNKDIEVNDFCGSSKIKSGNQYIFDIYYRVYQVGVVRKRTLTSTHLF